MVGIISRFLFLHVVLLIMGLIRGRIGRNFGLINGWMMGHIETILRKPLGEAQETFWANTKP